MSEGRRLALVIASSEFSDPTLQRLITPGLDAVSLARAVEDPSIGNFSVKTLINRPASEIQREIEAFFVDSKKNDLVLLYFSGHGVIDDDGRLYLATIDTRRGYYRSTAIPTSFINETMTASRSRKQILILDCCHSGAFARGLVAKGGDSVDIRERFEGRGRIVLTASNATQYAFQGDKVIGQPQQSVFTRHLVHGLVTGDADLDCDGRITIDELYDYVYERVIDETPQQTPGKWTFDLQGDIIIASSRHGAQEKIPSEVHLAVSYADGLAALTSGQWKSALAIFEKLEAAHPGYKDVADKIAYLRPIIFALEQAEKSKAPPQVQKEETAAPVKRAEQPATRDQNQMGRQRALTTYLPLAIALLLIVYVLYRYIEPNLRPQPAGISQPTPGEISQAGNTASTQTAVAQLAATNAARHAQGAASQTAEVFARTTTAQEAETQQTEASQITSTQEMITIKVTQTAEEQTRRVTQTTAAEQQPPEKKAVNFSTGEGQENEVINFYNWPTITDDHGKMGFEAPDWYAMKANPEYGLALGGYDGFNPYSIRSLVGDFILDMKFTLERESDASLTITLVDQDYLHHGFDLNYYFGNSVEQSYSISEKWLALKGIFEVKWLASGSAPPSYQFVDWEKENTISIKREGSLVSFYVNGDLLQSVEPSFIKPVKAIHLEIYGGKAGAIFHFLSIVTRVK